MGDVRSKGAFVHGGLDQRPSCRWMKYSFCGSELVFPDFAVPVDRREEAGGVYLAACSEYVIEA